MKQIPVELREHLAQPATTWCLLMRVSCRGQWSGTVLGFTTLDAALRYDDGAGEVLYRPDNGFAPERFQAAADFGVDNSDLQGWITDTGITEQDILAGIFDFAEVTIYRVNYMALEQGHEIVAHGTLGQTQFSDRSWRCEYRGLMQQARQPQGEVYSLTCRAKYGDERCKMPLEWFDATVQSVGADPQRMLVAAGLTQPDGYFDLGVVEFTTGLNAGADMEVDEYLASGSIRLALPMPYPIEAGDTFRIRRDCPKTVAACKARGNLLNFRGEHLTPVADTALSVPGAYIKSVDSR